MTNIPTVRPMMHRAPISQSSKPILTFAPLAWLKLQFFCHAGDTEVGGFAITAMNAAWYIEDFITVPQDTSLVSVRFDDQAVANYFDECVDRGLTPDRFARIWLHTHPGSSVTPSATDEQTFSRVFGRCGWSIMAILGRTGRTYARLNFTDGPQGAILLKSRVDWAMLPEVLSDRGRSLDEVASQWRDEYVAHIRAEPISSGIEASSPRTSPFDLAFGQDFDFQSPNPHENLNESDWLF